MDDSSLRRTLISAFTLLATFAALTKTTLDDAAVKLGQSLLASDDLWAFLLSLIHSQEIQSKKGLERDNAIRVAFASAGPDVQDAAAIAGIDWATVISTSLWLIRMALDLLGKR
jgi:allophanate hydrolase subunit 1